MLQWLRPFLTNIWAHEYWDLKQNYRLDVQSDCVIKNSLLSHVSVVWPGPGPGPAGRRSVTSWRLWTSRGGVNAAATSRCQPTSGLPCASPSPWWTDLSCSRPPTSETWTCWWGPLIWVMSDGSPGLLEGFLVMLPPRNWMDQRWRQWMWDSLVWNQRSDDCCRLTCYSTTLYLPVRTPFIRL